MLILYGIKFAITLHSLKPSFKSDLDHRRTDHRHFKVISATTKVILATEKMITTTLKVFSATRNLSKPLLK